MPVNANAQTATPPVGSGTSADPYQIATLDNLYWLSQNNGEWGKHYKQMANIDASATSGWDGGRGFSPIGNGSGNFTGTYDGSGHKINGLYINRPSTNYVGLFGYTYVAIIKNLGVTNVSVSGHQHVGGLVGENGYYSTYQIYSTISNSYSTGSVKGDYEVGGLAGRNHGGTISIATVCADQHLCRRACRI
ncbi:MAG: hypothetical protein HGB26_06680 [Desulfobulbaceae bacterium]|nr:hypothetical protein [Desulfobulbaceae bacterium]